jgi:hypothetical protein
LRDESNRVDTNVSTTSTRARAIDSIDSSSTSRSPQGIDTKCRLQEWCEENKSRDSLATIEGRDIEEEVLPRKYSHKTTDLTVRAIVLQIKARELYGLNVPAKVTTAIPLDSCATTAVIQRQCLLPEEGDTAVVAVAMEGEAQRLLLLPRQSLQELVQS